MTSERATIGVYLRVGYSDADLDPKRIELIEDNLATLRKQSGWTLEVVCVDARPGTEKSASKS